jgi:ribose 1,5-bisphosphokinase
MEPAVPTRLAAAGTLVLVAGPSGAGKDSLIGGARLALAGDARFVFARRIVTRPASRWEEHSTLDEATFAAAEATGQFALSWRAHGLCYGLDRAINDDLVAGRIVVANVSRAMVEVARSHYVRTHALLIDADPAVRAARLSGRAREAASESRTSGSRAFPAIAYDTVIDNSAELAPAVAAFVAVLRSVLV